jgi:hypothetical protein
MRAGASEIIKRGFGVSADGNSTSPGNSTGRVKTARDFFQ